MTGFIAICIAFIGAGFVVVMIPALVEISMKEPPTEDDHAFSRALAGLGLAILPLPGVRDGLHL